MSDPNFPCENHLKRKFEELPGQAAIADRPRNKRRGSFRLEFVISRECQPDSADGSSINIARPSSAPPTSVTPSSTIRAADIAMPVNSKIPFNLPAPKGTLITH